MQETFTFARLRSMGWYLVITASDYSLMNTVHKSCTVTAAKRYWNDPHMVDITTGQPKNSLAEMYHPVKLAGGWIQTVEKGLQKFGTVYVNKQHGLWFGSDVDILDTYTCTQLKFPDDKIKDLKIVISRYPGGAHWYLTPSDGSIFQYHKFNALGYALEEAQKHCLNRNITVDENIKQSISGD